MGDDRDPNGLAALAKQLDEDCRRVEQNTRNPLTGRRDPYHIRIAALAALLRATIERIEKDDDK